MISVITCELTLSLPVTCSHDVTREFREYECASTTALAAYNEPVIDIATVGAAGGSIAWADEGGLLRAGPGSAGVLQEPSSHRAPNETAIGDTPLRESEYLGHRA